MRPRLPLLRGNTPSSTGPPQSAREKRGGYVDMDTANRPDVIAVLRQLGFRDAPRVSGFSPSGRHLRQDATG
jgi:hypothetical protein